MRSARIRSSLALPADPDEDIPEDRLAPETVEELQVRRMQFAREMRRVREAVGLSQAEFANRFRIRFDQLRDFEQARDEPDLLIRVVYQLILEDPAAAEMLIRRVERRGVTPVEPALAR